MDTIISIIIFCGTFLFLYLLFNKKEPFETSQPVIIPESTQNTIEGLIDVGCWLDNMLSVSFNNNNNYRTISPKSIKMNVSTPQQIYNNDLGIQIDITVPSNLLNNTNINDWNRWALTIANQYGFDTIGYQNNNDIYFGKYNSVLGISYSNNKPRESYTYKYDKTGMIYNSCKTFGDAWINHVFIKKSLAVEIPEIFKGLKGVCRTANNLYPPWTGINSTTFDDCKKTCLNDAKCSGYSFKPPPNTLIISSTLGECQLFDISTAKNAGTAPRGTLLTKGNDLPDWNCFIVDKTPPTTTTTTTKNIPTTTTQKVYTGLQGLCRTADDKYPPIKSSGMPIPFFACKSGCEDDSLCSGYAFAPFTPGKPITEEVQGYCQHFDSTWAISSPTIVGTAPSRTRLTKGDGSPNWNCFLTRNNPN